MSEVPELYYFNARGLAELIRLVLTATGVEVEAQFRRYR